MSDYIVPRSVKRLEDEIAELEKKVSGSSGEDEEVEQEEVEEVEETSAPVEEEAPVTKEEETFKKRYSDLRRHSQKLADDLKEAQAALKNQKTSPGLPTAEEAEEWAKANPKAAAIIRAIAMGETVSASEEINTIKDKLNRAEQEARIFKVHPDFEDVTSEEPFHDWAEQQPQSVQKLIYSNSADDVIWAIGQYKKEKADKPNHKKEAAKAVSSKTSFAEPKTEGKGRFTESMISKMSMSEYEKNETAIQESMRNGTFIYDLSGAAR
jgi:hypothetical protein